MAKAPSLNASMRGGAQVDGVCVDRAVVVHAASEGRTNTQCAVWDAGAPERK